MSVGIAVRVGLGITLGGAAIAALAFGVGMAARSEEAGEEGAEPAVSVEQTRIGVPVHWRGEAERIIVRLDEDFGVSAPVVQVLPSGRMKLLRPAPAPEGPLATAWVSACIQLPAPVADLAPEARTAFLALCAAWSGGGGLTEERLESVGFELDGAAVQHLLRWQR